MFKLILASNNKGKLVEFDKVFAQFDTQIISQSQFNVPEAEETGLSFIENAMIKARNACRHTGLPAVGDDSGLEVDALDGKPGIYSARFAGLDVTHRDHINKLLDVLRDVPEKRRTARFRCVLVLMRHEEDPAPIIAQGKWEGRILTESLGENGFGYDPIFFVPHENCSAAQLSSERKNQLSHRSQAIHELIGRMNNESFVH